MPEVKIGEFAASVEDDEDTRIAKEYLRMFCSCYQQEGWEEKIREARSQLTVQQAVICIQCLLREKIPPPESF